MALSPPAQLFEKSSQNDYAAKIATQTATQVAPRNEVKYTQPKSLLGKIILIPILLIVVFYFVDIFLRKKMWKRIFKKISFNTVILLIILFILLAFIVFPKGNKTNKNTKLASPPKTIPTSPYKIIPTTVIIQPTTDIYTGFMLPLGLITDLKLKSSSNFLCDIQNGEKISNLITQYKDDVASLRTCVETIRTNRSLCIDECQINTTTAYLKLPSLASCKDECQKDINNIEQQCIFACNQKFYYNDLESTICSEESKKEKVSLELLKKQFLKICKEELVKP